MPFNIVSPTTYDSTKPGVGQPLLEPERMRFTRKATRTITAMYAMRARPEYRPSPLRRPQGVKTDVELNFRALATYSAPRIAIASRNTY